MTSPTLTPEKQFATLAGQATRLIATQIMGWTLEETSFRTDGVPRDAYYDGETFLGYTDEYKFNPAISTQDAFWVMDTLAKNHNVRFDIDYDPKCECTVSSRRFRRNVTGNGSTLPIATLQMALYVIAEEKPFDSDQQEAIYALSRELYDAEEATLKFSEYTGDGLHIDLDKYRP